MRQPRASSRSSLSGRPSSEMPDRQPRAGPEAGGDGQARGAGVAPRIGVADEEQERVEAARLRPLGIRDARGGRADERVDRVPAECLREVLAKRRTRLLHRYPVDGAASTTPFSAGSLRGTTSPSYVPLTSLLAIMAATCSTLWPTW